MTARIADSAMYAHLWGTPQTRALFEERARMQGWLDIWPRSPGRRPPRGSSRPTRPRRSPRRANVDLLDLDQVARQTRATGHSTLGLIQAMRDVLPADVHPYLNVGATVQDVTDTWTALALREVVADCPGRPAADRGPRCSLPLPSASRHPDRRADPRPAGCAGHLRVEGGLLGRRGRPAPGPAAPRASARWLVGQLGGGVGTLAGQGPAGLAVRATVLRGARARRPGHLVAHGSRPGRRGRRWCMAMITGTLARIGGEVYELQRPEIGELREPQPRRGRRQHHDAAQAQSRAQRAPGHPRPAGPRLMPACCWRAWSVQHERDGRSWKAEWVALPGGLPADRDGCVARRATCWPAWRSTSARCGRNLDDYTGSEQVAGAAHARLGRHTARRRLQTALAAGRRTGRTVAEASSTPACSTGDEAAALQPDTGHAAARWSTWLSARARTRP